MMSRRGRFSDLGSNGMEFRRTQLPLESDTERRTARRIFYERVPTTSIFVASSFSPGTELSHRLAFQIAFA